LNPYDQTQWRATHQNGRIARSELAEIPGDLDKDLQGPALMHPEAAWNFQRMRDEAKATGVNLEISYSYRTFEKQVHKFELSQNGGNLAATPGTSNHGWGLALDLSIPAYPAANSNAQFTWLKSNARRYGFFNDDAPSEPWHWDYEGGHPIEEDEMTPEEKAEFEELKKLVANHEKLITALREGLRSPEDPTSFQKAGTRVAKSVRRSEEETKGSGGGDGAKKAKVVKSPA
jgi:hypothetical protein